MRALSGSELDRFLAAQRQVFDIVRLVDVSASIPYAADGEGELEAKRYRCFHFWERTERCANCTSARSIDRMQPQIKLDARESHLYLVVSQPVLISGKLLILEALACVDDEFDTPAERAEQIRALEESRASLYLDADTGIGNRAYFDKHLIFLDKINCAVALKIVNQRQLRQNLDPPALACLLEATAATVRSYIRQTDMMVRYDDDLFLFLFQGIPLGCLVERLKLIRDCLAELRLPTCPSAQVDVRMGCVFGYNAQRDVAHALEAVATANQNPDRFAVLPSCTAEPQEREQVQFYQVHLKVDENCTK